MKKNIKGLAVLAALGILAGCGDSSLNAGSSAPQTVETVAVEEMQAVTPRNGAVPAGQTPAAALTDAATGGKAVLSVPSSAQASRPVMPKKSIDVDYGVYQGRVPAQTGSVSVTLTLNADGTFTLSETAASGGRSETVSESGTFGLDGTGVLTLTFNAGGRRYFNAEDDSLRVLNQNKQAVTGPNAGQYVLQEVEVED